MVCCGIIELCRSCESEFWNCMVEVLKLVVLMLVMLLLVMLSMVWCECRFEILVNREWSMVMFFWKGLVRIVDGR